MRVEIQSGGYFKKNRNKTISPDVKPPKFNTNPALSGALSPQNYLDLTLGTQGFKDEGGGHGMEYILEYIKHEANKRNMRKLRDVVKSDFVTNRGTMTTIAESYYNSKSVIKCLAIRQKDVIFIHKLEIGAPYDAVAWGYKFEQYMTLDDNGKPIDKNTPVSNAEQIKCVMTAKLDDISVYYGAEVDALNGNEHVEIKASKNGINDSKGNWWRFKSLSVYLQAYFGNTANIVVGNRNDDLKIVAIDTLTAPQINASSKKRWNVEDCKTRLLSVLKDVKNKMTQDGMVCLVEKGVSGPFTYKLVSPTSADCDFHWYNTLDNFSQRFD